MTGEAILNPHVGELALRRLRAGESFAADVTAHAGACADCRARLRVLDEEQRRFEQEISFDRFAAGIERAARASTTSRAARASTTSRAARASTTPARRSPRRVWRVLVPTLSLAAGVALFVTMSGGERGHNTIKGGGAGITVRVAAGEGPQRTAAERAPEALAPGERVRIGYQAGTHRYLLSLSIDDRGNVTPLYPEAGRSVALGKAVGAGPRYLPDSVEFTDAGTERLFVILSDAPIDVDAARRAARASFDKVNGDILHMPALELPGEQFQRTFIKP